MAAISENMVHPGGFEPPTARFVAEYSIQLSYGCIGKLTLLQILIPLLKPYQVRWCIREDDSPCGSPFGAVAKATLSSLVLAANTATSSTPSLLKVWRIWCIREDSNLRPLGS